MDDLDAVRRGDLEARERWVADWWPRVYRMALALAGREADAEDLAQETLSAALGAVDRFRGDSSQSTWLYAILLKKHLSRRRRAAGPVPAPAPPPAPELEEALALLARLPAAQRIAAALFYVEDMTIEEIAGALGVPRATVRWRLFRARQALRSSRLGAVWKEVL